MLTEVYREKSSTDIFSFLSNLFQILEAVKNLMQVLQEMCQNIEGQDKGQCFLPTLNILFIGNCETSQ